MLIYLGEDLIEKQLKEAEVSTSVHKHHPGHVDEEWLCPWGLKNGLGKRENTRKLNNISRNS